MRRLEPASGEARGGPPGPGDVRSNLSWRAKSELRRSPRRSASRERRVVAVLVRELALES